MYDFLSEFKAKDYIYIDLLDLRNDIEEISQNLAKFIKMNEITVLVIENYNFQFELPSCENIVISMIRPEKIKGFVAVLFFIPYLTSGVATSVFVKYLFDYNSVLNVFLRDHFQLNINWLTDQRFAFSFPTI